MSKEKYSVKIAFLVYISNLIDYTCIHYQYILVQLCYMTTSPVYCDLMMVKLILKLPTNKFGTKRL
jgi:hypothetical protein